VLAACAPLPENLARWFGSRGWVPHAFQLDAWQAWREGRSGLIHVPTGAGKTYAAYLGPLGSCMEARSSPPPLGLSIIYITPLRAVSRDIEKALRRPVEELELPLTVGSRTGDTETAERAKQRQRPPDVLVTTPESLTLLLTADQAGRTFSGVQAVIVDEWHELLSSKRGVQVELALARLRRFAPRVRTWALSATLRDPLIAARVAVGAGTEPLVIEAAIERPVVVSSVLPDAQRRLPWAGHLGMVMLEPLLRVLDPAHPTLIFTNTRSQAERWFAEILKARPEWAERLALHHGSIDREIREHIEAGLKTGSTTLVVCTSSLDLGVDFGPVERVVQVGSPKGIARLMQRAGRAGHRPGAACEVICVPTHALELVEIAAAREAIRRRQVEERPSLRRPLDVLIQHLVTCSFGEGFEEGELLEELRGTVSYSELTEEEFRWCLELVEHGGDTLRAYPQHHRVCREHGRWRVAGRRVAAIHRLNVGTITGEATIALRLIGGPVLGSIEEFFISRLRRGEVFLFAGRMLEFDRLRDLTAFVRPARADTSFTPHWNGARFPLSTALSMAVRETIELLGAIDLADPPEDLPQELRAVLPVIAAQRELSVLPARRETLVELLRSEEGAHCFVYPFEGRLVHEGLAALLALRLGRIVPGSFGIAINDYGLELLSQGAYDFAALLSAERFAADHLVDDLLEAINLGELARRQFREVARVAGLLPQRYPGAERGARQLQAGAALLFEVFSEFDPRNLLLLQARREVLERHCEESRLHRTMARLSAQPLRVVSIARPTPLALPLMADRMGTTLSTETLGQRVKRELAREHSPRRAR
jgi:ATP-dependent Lhr-like helicase